MGSTTRIAFDVTPLVRPHPRGVVRATEGLLDELERRGELEVVRIAPQGEVATGRWRQTALVREARRAACAGIHSPISAFPLLRAGRGVHTVHELPWLHGVAENADLRHRFWATLGARAAGRTIVPSAHVARDVLAMTQGRARIEIVPWGLAPAFARELDRTAPARARTPYVLAIGANRAKKELAATIRALAQARALRDVELLVTGAPSDDLARDLELARTLGIDARVRAVGEVDDDELVDLIRAASSVVVLSRSEGFAFPVIEAFACATPVVVAAGGAQAELADGLGFEVDPDDPRQVAAALARAPTTREPLAAARRERARSFTWSRAAAQVERIWSELA